MNYNELPDDEIDMLIATRAAGWELTEETAYSPRPNRSRWARIPWGYGRSRERWLPYYTTSFDDVIEAIRHAVDTNEKVIRPFAQLNVFMREVTPRALCILILEALDAAADNDLVPGPRCDPEVYQNGKGIAVVDMGAKECDGLVMLATQMTGQKVDWFSAAGRRIIKALGDTDTVREWFRSYFRRGCSYRIIEENGEWS